MAFQNPYATRLKDFSSFTFDERALEDSSGAWARGWEHYFLDRMGRRPSRTILEIGCSNATFLTDIAVARPQDAFIGIDWKYKVIYKGAKRVEAFGLTNVALLRGRAQLLDRVFKENELDEIWILFPDPWAKSSQLKHRLMQEPFLTEAHRLLKTGGRIYFKTDHPGYLQWVLALFGERPPELSGYEDEAPAGRSRRARQIKVRRPERQENLPDANERVQGLFTLKNVKLDYWEAPPSEDEEPFGSKQTLFEKMFLKDELPIYYLELHSRK